MKFRPVSAHWDEVEMTYENDARFLQTLIVGDADPQACDVLGRLVMMRAQYSGIGEAGMVDLINRSFATLTRARDCCYLESLIDGTGDLLAEDTMKKLEPLFARYEANAEMNALLEQAAMAYSDAALWAAYWVMAGVVIDEARRGI